MIMYKLLLNPMTGNPHNVIFRTEGNAFIPMVEDNTDYQAYLKWVALGNTPEPAENTQ
jgi:hypothetical protein